ncbi:Brp/Blh family beta-carotene 15,15'-dioxygenase [Sphingomicrobium arenosum]|uniref:Brp/Blh family beta-carotene 15,15'-dioxygenase n=1 Tax=Sphingomicrobium arenosum TaxID=2233861 RepID=UPI00223F7444|nr:Brp/Blh family beta-carotene 15,15'-dioxygenase [Sphingomicrobium arenosum]
MTRAEVRFGLVGIAAAILAGLGVPSLLLAGALLAVGVFHGAIDAEAERLVRPGLGYSLVYLALIGCAAAYFIAAPVNGLMLFFALSAWHFAHENRQRGVSLAAAWGEGLMLIGGVFLLRPVSTHAILEWMGVDGAAPLAMPLALIGLAGPAMLVLGGHRLRALLLLAAYALLDPLLAIALHFTMLHALVRIEELVARLGRHRAAAAILPFGLAALAGAALLVAAVLSGAVPPLVFTALALAALIPHMLLDRSWGTGQGAIAAA